MIFDKPYMYSHQPYCQCQPAVFAAYCAQKNRKAGRIGRAKLDISVVNGWNRLEYFSFDAYNEAGNLQAMAKRFRERHYPSRILADKIYRNRDNLRFCKERGIHLAGPALGRPKKNEVRNKTQDFLDECERVEVERRFSLAKRRCGLDLIVTKLQETIAHAVAMSILLLNLWKIQCTIFHCFVFLLHVLCPKQKSPFVQ